MKVIDLTHTLENGMSVYPGAPEPVFERVGNVPAGDVYQLTKFEMTTHVGTHIDCNTHVQPTGYCTDSQDMSFFMGKGVVIDCSSYADGAEMGMEIFDGIDLENKEFVLLYCDWAKYWGEDKFWGDFPYVSMEVVEFIANNKDIKGIGFEYATIDPLEDTGLTLHKALMKEEKTIIENLTNLDALIGKEFTFIALPLKFKGGDGSPVRAVAVVEE